MPSDQERLRLVLVALTAQSKKLEDTMKLLHNSVVSFHREWRTARAKDLGLCTCPWNQNPFEGPRGHHVLCPFLKQIHHPGDDCDHIYGHMDKEITNGE